MSPFENVYSSANDLYHFKHRSRRRLVTLIKLVVSLFVLYEIVTIVFATSFEVGSIAMRPLLYRGDRLIASPLAYGAWIPFTSVRLPGIVAPRRGDIVLAHPAYYSAPPWYLEAAEPIVRFFTLQKVDLANAVRYRTADLVVKRIVGIPGDTVAMRHFVIFVKPRGETDFVRETELSRASYTVAYDHLPDAWPADFPLSGDMAPVTLGADSYFLAGDNRTESSDSVLWGPATGADIVAKVVFRYWPLSVITAF